MPTAGGARLRNFLKGRARPEEFSRLIIGKGPKSCRAASQRVAMSIVNHVGQANSSAKISETGSTMTPARLALHAKTCNNGSRPRPVKSAKSLREPRPTKLSLRCFVRLASPPNQCPYSINSAARLLPTQQQSRFSKATDPHELFRTG